MNERIRDLKGKTLDKHFSHTWSTMDYDDVSKFAEKFAELIVKEMCNVLDKEQWNIGRDWICDDGTRIIPKVKEHFGVE